MLSYIVCYFLRNSRNANISAISPEGGNGGVGQKTLEGMLFTNTLCHERNTSHVTIAKTKFDIRIMYNGVFAPKLMLPARKGGATAKSLNNLN
jgi:hypothetical protein